jgi:hypothetical protein
MIKIRAVPFSLYVSAASFVLFVGFSMFVNNYSQSYEQEIEEVRREQTFAAERLEMVHKQKARQKRRADSLEVIVEASKRKEVLWTARAIYSETKRIHEMRYVAWVVRNRYESGFRGETFKDVILHPKQFSAFNRGNPRRSYYLSLQPKDATENARWHKALQIAKGVIDSPFSWNPLPPNTYHFYSERSMEGRNHPSWRWRLTHVEVEHIEENRFRFFKGSRQTTTTAKAR